MTNTSRENYTHISENLVCPEDKNIEYCQELQKIADLCCEFSDGFIQKLLPNNSNLERQPFRDCLTYVVTGRIIRLSHECLRKDKFDEPVVEIARQMGEHVHKKLGIDIGAEELKGIDYESILNLAQTAFEIIDPEILLGKVTTTELNLVRKLGSELVPHYSMGESSTQAFTLD